MNIDTQIIYILILIFCSLVILCITLTYLYIKTLNKFAVIKEDPIIESAKKISEKIINSTKDLDNKHDLIMVKVVDRIVAKWTENAEQIFSKNAKLLDEELKKKIEKIYQEENYNIDLYKKQKIKEFDDLLLDSIKKLSREIISKEIDLNDHKKIISESLERAKKIGFFK